MVETLKYDRKHGPIRQIYLVITVTLITYNVSVKSYTMQKLTPLLPTTRINNAPFKAYGPMLIH
jgi:hypothetical protein